MKCHTQVGMTYVQFDKLFEIFQVERATFRINPHKLDHAIANSLMIMPKKPLLGEIPAENGPYTYAENENNKRPVNLEMTNGNDHQADGITRHKTAKSSR